MTSAVLTASTSSAWLIGRSSTFSRASNSSRMRVSITSGSRRVTTTNGLLFGMDHSPVSVPPQAPSRSRDGFGTYDAQPGRQFLARRRNGRIRHRGRHRLPARARRRSDLLNQTKAKVARASTRRINLSTRCRANDNSRAAADGQPFVACLCARAGPIGSSAGSGSEWLRSSAPARFAGRKQGAHACPAGCTGVLARGDQCWNDAPPEQTTTQLSCGPGARPPE